MGAALAIDKIETKLQELAGCRNCTVKIESWSLVDNWGQGSHCA
jgi:hypothetical protein